MKTLRTSILTAFGAAALLILSSSASAEFATVQLRATDDAYVDSNYPDANYGASLNTYVGDRASQAGGTCLSFYQFDITAVPANAEITNAELWLCEHEKYGTPEQTFTVDVHLITGPGWDQNAITWNAPPAYQHLPTASATGTFNPPGWAYWNVTPDVAGARPSGTLVGWAVKMNPLPQWAWLNFYTSEQVPMPDYRPMLEITYNTIVGAEASSWSRVKTLFR